jgi:hypothetical protein
MHIAIKHVYNNHVHEAADKKIHSTYQNLIHCSHVVERDPPLPLHTYMYYYTVAGPLYELTERDRVTGLTHSAPFISYSNW